ncbi:MAG: RNase A-like domain-containing protein [Hyphomicrobium sp.]
MDLLEDEQNGGHTIARHVAKAPETIAGYVRDSILADPDPARHDIRSGSFPSLEAANKLVNSTLARNRAIVDGVARGMLPEQRIDSFFGSVTGIEAYASTIRSQPRIRETYGVGVYIRRDPSVSRGYRVITAYPRNLD